LLVDELNRTNLDEAFGKVFTQLDLDYRSSGQPIELGDADREGDTTQYKSQTVPLAFRMLAPMNRSDQAQLFALGYAFRRRFAFIQVPSLLADSEIEAAAGKRAPVPDIDRPSLEDRVEDFNEGLLELIAGKFSIEGDLPNDTPLCFDGVPDTLTSEEGLQSLHSRIQTQGSATAIETLLYLAQEANGISSLELGQGLVIDAVKYVLVNAAVFPGQVDWRVVDEAVAAYYLPQFDVVMPELRKEEITGTAADGPSLDDELDEYAETLGNYNLPVSEAIIERARTQRTIL
jgi:hypothetical protein